MHLSGPAPLSHTTARAPATASRRRPAASIGFALAALLVAGVLVWQAITAGGVPDPTAAGTNFTAGSIDIAVLVFREGLECILVLTAITASMVGASRALQRPVAFGVGLGLLLTLATWFIAVRVIDSLTESVPALHVQALTGLLAIVVLLVVMNWFFHKIYWAGWISLHTRRKRELLRSASSSSAPRRRILIGLVMLGFTSFYREGFEVVLFLQTYRLRLGGGPVLSGVLLGALLSAAVAVLTFAAKRRLPYKKMLVATGFMLGVVLLVMVGEQAQEMQLAHWLPTTQVPALARVIPAWMGLWFSVFPTVETLIAQLIAAVLVLGSFVTVHLQLARARRPA